METPRRSKLPLPLVERCPTLRGVSRKMTGEEEVGNVEMSEI